MIQRGITEHGSVILTDEEWKEYHALARKPGVTLAEFREFLESRGYEWLEQFGKSLPSHPNQAVDSVE